MSTKTVRIDAAVMDRVRAHCPQYLSLTQFCNLILDQELRMEKVLIFQDMHTIPFVQCVLNLNCNLTEAKQKY